MITLYSLSLFRRAHVSLMVLCGSRPANDPSTANDPQVGPQMISRQEMILRDCTANDGIFAIGSDTVKFTRRSLFNLIIVVIYVFKDIPFTFHEFCLSIA